MVPAYCLVIEANPLSPVVLAMVGALRGKQRVMAARHVVLPALAAVRRGCKQSLHPFPGPQGAPQAAPGGAQ